MKRLFALLLTLLLLTACAGTKKADKDHNDADIAFAQAMIPHHEQAVEMADLVDGAGASPQVTRLASQIKAAQAPEIEQLNGFLDDWGVKDDEMDGMAGQGSGHDDHGSMSGMMSADQMTALAEAKGSQFDTAWLTMMIAHHEGAVEMAKTELADGRSSSAKDLAQKIVAAQDDEISTMKELLE